MTMSSVFFEHRIKVRHLRVIEALDRQKSLLRASRVLNVTQPALTRVRWDQRASGTRRVCMKASKVSPRMMA